MNKSDYRTSKRDEPDIEINNITRQSFQKPISRNDIPLLVDVWASWCGPCKMMAPQFEQAAAQLELLPTLPGISGSLPDGNMIPTLLRDASTECQCGRTGHRI